MLKKITTRLHLGVPLLGVNTDIKKKKRRKVHRSAGQQDLIKFTLIINISFKALVEQVRERYLTPPLIREESGHRLTWYTYLLGILGN